MCHLESGRKNNSDYINVQIKRLSEIRVSPFLFFSSTQLHLNSIKSQKQVIYRVRWTHRVDVSTRQSPPVCEGPWKGLGQRAAPDKLTQSHDLCDGGDKCFYCGRCWWIIYLVLSKIKQEIEKSKTGTNTRKTGLMLHVMHILCWRYPASLSLSGELTWMLEEGERWE